MRRLLMLALLGACYRAPQGPPPAPQPQPWQEAAGDEWMCTMMATPAAQGSLCFAQYERCEAERAQATADGAQAAPCRPQAPVSCFQLHGDPSPSMEMCAATPQDCDLLRLIDRDKSGQTGGVCEWRHGPGLPR